MCSHVIYLCYKDVDVNVDVDVSGMWTSFCYYLHFGGLFRCLCEFLGPASFGCCKIGTLQGNPA